MKPIEGYNKLRGGYYTPKKIAEFIATWAIRTKNDEILEPSCGDGSFISAIADRLHEMGASDQSIKHNVTGVELDKVEASKASQYGPNVVQSDFFTYYQKCIDGEKEFDVIVGNPPFIRYQNFEEEYRKVAFELMTKHGFQPNRLMNIWLPFLVLACKALKPDGRVGMVIPAELFQVDYAAEARLFLSNYFESLTLVTFKKLVFDDIQQEVILLLGESSATKQHRTRCRERTVDIWKVHGSLDWFVDRNDKIISVPMSRKIPEGFYPLVVPPGKEKYSSTHKEPYRSIIAEADKAFIQAGAYLCIGYGFNDEHIQPKLLAQIATGKPIIILARTMTEACRKHIIEAKIRKYLIFERADDQHTTVYSNGWSETYDGQYWSLEEFLKIW